jgi:hypothetical protein
MRLALQASAKFYTVKVYYHLREDRLVVEVRRYSRGDFPGLACLYRAFFNEMREWQGWNSLKLDQKEAEATAREGATDLLGHRLRLLKRNMPRGDM